MQTISFIRPLLGAVGTLSLLCSIPSPASAQIVWSETGGLPGENINSVWGTSPNALFASGGYRTLDSYDGSSWTASSHPSGANRYNLYGVSASEIYSAGQASYQTGNLMKYDGANWSTVFSTSQSELIDVWTDGSGKIFVTGDGRFYGFDGSLWSEIPTGLATGYNTNRLGSVWGTSASNVYATGYNGNLLHWDGTSATVTQPFGSGIGFNDITGTSASNIFLVGQGGNAFHFNGSVWSPIATGTTADLYGVFAMSGGKVLVSGAGGSLFMTDGVSFTQIASGTSRDLYGIFGLHEGDTDYWWVAASGNGRTEGGVILTGTEFVSGSTVPEPATLVLLATGLITLAGRRRMGSPVRQRT